MNRSEAGRLGAIKLRENNAKRRIIKEALERKQYEQIPKLCPECNNVIPFEKRNNKFCNRGCGASYHNAKRESKRTISFCLHCGKEIQPNGKYCNNTCKGEYEQKQFENILETNKSIIIREDNAIPHKRRLKKYLIKKYGDKCAVCGIENWQGKPLVKVLDHVDGDHSNNKLDNFRLVCSNCDSQLPTYKAKNKNGVKWRKKYYKPVSPNGMGAAL